MTPHHHTHCWKVYSVRQRRRLTPERWTAPAPRVACWPNHDDDRRCVQAPSSDPGSAPAGHLVSIGGDGAGHLLAPPLDLTPTAHASLSAERTFMLLSPLALVWLLVACGCIVAGTYLTTRRLPHIPTRPQLPPRRCRCGQLLSASDRFCGSCGRRIGQRPRERHVDQQA